MAHKVLPRSAWSSTSARGTGITWSRVRGIVCHYPAMGNAVGVLTQAQEAARLRGWRSYHVNSLGWLDIGYSYAIGRSGRIYSLRGDLVGGHTYGHNSTTLGVLFIVGDNEPLTAAAKAAFRALRATLRKRGASSGVWGHREMSGNSTRCPGPFIMGSIRDGSLTGSSAGASKPRTPSAEFADVDKTQAWLKELGFDPGPLDGIYGTNTATATRAAQKALGITPVDGRPGPTTRTHLEDAVTTLDKISKDLAAIKRTLEPRISGKRTDGELVSTLRGFRNDIPGMVLDAPVALEGKWKGQKSTLRRMRAWYAEDLRQIKAGIAASRAADTSREIGYSSVTQGEGSLDLLTPSGDVRASLGDQPDGRFGVSIWHRGQLRFIPDLIQELQDEDEALSGRISGLGDRMVTAEGRLDNHNGRISGLGDRMVAAEGTLSSHNTRISNAQSRADAAHSNAATAQSRADSAWTRAGTGIANAATAQARADSAHTRINGLNYASPGDISTLSNQVQSLRSQVHDWMQTARASNPDLPPPIPG